MKLYAHVLILLFCIPLTISACGKKEQPVETSITTEASAQNTTEEANILNPPKTSKVIMNGFREDTVQTLTFHGIDIPIPSYFKPGNKNSDTEWYYYAENNNPAVAMLYFRAQSHPYPNLTASEIPAQCSKDIAASVDHAIVLDNQEMTVAGYPAHSQTLYGVISDLPMLIRTVTIYDANTSKGIVITLSQSDETKLDYFSDFDKIITACSPQDHHSSESTPSEHTSMAAESETQAAKDEQDDSTSASTYEDIYNEYSKKLKTETDDYLDQHGTSVSIQDMEKAATEGAEEIEKLAEISTEGVEKMADLMYKKFKPASGYQEWSQKLYEYYEEQSMRITDAFTNIKY